MHSGTNAFNQILKELAFSKFFPITERQRTSNLTKTINAGFNESESRHGRGMSFHQDPVKRIERTRKSVISACQTCKRCPVP